jgi:membrane protease YdiL (CAAX protease family)
VFFIAFGIVTILIDRAVTGTLSDQQRFLMRGILQFMGAMPVLAIIFINRQGFNSIGIHKEKILPALRLGALFAMIFIAMGVILPGLLYDSRLATFGQLIFSLFVTFLFASSEDILFVGFLQTRMYGLFKSDKTAICTVAALFSLGHVPAWIMTGQLNFDELHLFGVFVIFWFVMHVAFVAIFMRYFSLIPVMLLHTIVNWTSGSVLVFDNEQYLGYAEEWHMTAVPIYIISVGIWAFVRYRRSKKKLT